MKSDPPPSGPDLGAGIQLSALADGAMLAGHSGGKPVLLARVGDEIFAVGAQCTHYSGPLADGLLVRDTVRCPWHHACFSLRTGEAIGAPALKPIACWVVERRGDTIRVMRELDASDGATPVGGVVRAPLDRAAPNAIVIVGAGAAGNAAAEMLRRQGYEGSVTLIGADPSPPYDRPNISKDYLAGSAPEDWIPLRPREFYAEHRIDLLTGTRVSAIDVAGKRVVLNGGATRTFDRLLLATGADPIVLSIPGARPPQQLPHVHYLRTLEDSRAIVAAIGHANRAVVIGASFIGLEVAASLRARGLEVHVIAPDAQPLAKVLGPELGAFIRAVHERHGVVFHLEQKPSAITKASVTLASGASIPADLVVIGVGVRPSVGLAEQAGLAMDNGVIVDEYLQTSAPDVFAAGDIARVPDFHSGNRIRVEHWVVAERQGQVAARNMLGAREPFRSVPFFWSAHFDTTISYVGHAETWDETVVSGDIGKGDASVAFRSKGTTLAVATVGRDRASLEAEVELAGKRRA